MSTPKRYRKKPVVIEALQFVLGTTTATELRDFCPPISVGACVDDDTDIRWCVIPTLEGQMDVSDGDFIIRGVKGEFYPCKPDVFAASYEEAE